MLTVEDYAKIRTANRDGMSVRAICRSYHHSHHTVTKALNNPEPTPYTRTKPPRAPVLGPFMHIIDQMEDFSSKSNNNVRKISYVIAKTGNRVQICA